MLLQDQDDAAEHAGPLAEIEFWRSRTVDLGGIRDQLDDTSEPLQQPSTSVLLSSHALADACIVFASLCIPKLLGSILIRAWSSKHTVLRQVHTMPTWKHVTPEVVRLPT